MFKFGFSDPSSNSEPFPPAAPPPPPNTPDEIPASIVPFVPPPAALSAAPHDFVLLCNAELRLIKSTATPPPNLAPPETDLVPAAYEGGYKLWECAIDLVDHLYPLRQTLFRDKSVLELGAGHALPSILAALHAPKTLHIHDYNAEVIRDITIPNLLANVPHAEAKYFAGSWRSLPSLLDDSYHVILSADTVYAPAQADALAVCILSVLPVDGVAFIAAKTYYFGVGGGMSFFKDCVMRRAKDAHVDIDIRQERELRDGTSNVREIIRIRRV